MVPPFPGWFPFDFLSPVHSLALCGSEQAEWQGSELPRTTDRVSKAVGGKTFSPTFYLGTADKPLLNLCRSSAVKLCLDDTYEPGHLTAALGNRRHTRRLMCGVAASRHPAHTCSSRSQAVVCHHGSCADTTVSAAAL